MSWLNLISKVVIVTGGSSGIGKAIVQELLDQDMKVVVADLNQIDIQNENLSFVKTDVSNIADLKNLVNFTIQKYQKIDVLVNNAGINIPRLLADSKQPESKYEFSEDTYDKIVGINEKGVFFLTQLVARNMISNKSGVIINVSSECGIEGSEGQSVYAASKAAMNSYTRSWAKELGKHGIRVVGVAPGILEETGLRTLAYEEALAYTRNITVDKLRAGYVNFSTIPIGRTGRLSDVANAVAYFMSERADYITGITCNVAGGKTRG